MYLRFNNVFNSIVLILVVGAFSSCEKDAYDEDIAPVITPQLTGMIFTADKNPLQLIDNHYCDIIGDSIVSCWIPYIVENKTLVASFEYDGSKLTLNDEYVENGETSFDYGQPVTLTVYQEDKQKAYKVLVHSFTGLPVVWLDTEERKEIKSKDEYINAHIKLVEDNRIRDNGTFEGDVKVKGRGNSTWNYFPKKPYRLKFDSKQSLLGEPADKSWILLANYDDKTMVRNQVAFYLSTISNLAYTPKFHYVELMLNRRYHGTYMLGDKIKIAPGRVNLDKHGILFEIDSWAELEKDASYFKVQNLKQPIAVKDPELKETDKEFMEAAKFITVADSVLYSENFADPEKGWRQYFDINSLVDFYIINEIAKNLDAFYWSSTYMTWTPGGKIVMGPVWDFDFAFGNFIHLNCENPEGFWTKDLGWYPRFFEDPSFVKSVRERYAFFYDKKNDIMSFINNNCTYLKYAAQENEKRWGTFYKETYPWVDYNIWGSYQNEVIALKQWINDRMNWLKIELSNI